MRLDTLELTNICQHEHLRWDFAGGLIGIYGPNGAGKSNALNVGCYSGLTNDYSRHAQNKAGLIRQQSGPDDKSEIRLVFTHDGHQVEVIRGLQRPTRHLLKVDGEKIATKANEIQEHLEEVLGIKRNLIDNYMFIGQDDLYAFLSDTPATRAKAFAHLCNTVHAEQCWQVLGEFIEMDRELAESVVDNTDEIRQSIGKYNKQLRGHQKRVKELQQEILAKHELAEYQLQIKQWEELSVLMQRVPQLEEETRDKKQKARAANKAMKTAAESVPAIEQAYEKAKERHLEAKHQADDFAEQKRRWDRRCSLEVRLSSKQQELEEEQDESSLPKKPKGPIVERLRVHYQRAKDERRRIAEFLENIANGEVTECPTCGTPVSDLEDHIAHERERYEEVTAERDQLQARIDEWDTYTASWSEHRNTLERLAGEINTLTQQLSEYESAEEPESFDEEKLEKLRKKASHCHGQLKMAREEELETTRIFERAKAAHKASQKAWDESRQRLDALSELVTESDYDIAVEEVEKHVAADRELNRVQAAIENVESFIAERREELERIEVQLKRSKDAKVWLADLQDVRDNVMHRDQLPAIVHRTALANMEDEVNSNLAQFESPFFVSTDNSLGFTAKFANGTVMPAQGLSGGQKVMLALSFLLTVSSMFAGQVGMMILDEPTDGLDADNRRLAAEVFRNLGRVARSRDYQIIVITHEDALQSAFDQRFTLEKSG